MHETCRVHPGHLLPGTLFADGSAAGDLRHGRGVRHRAHRRTQHPHRFSRLHLQGPDGPADAHRPPLAQPGRNAISTGYIASAPQARQVLDFVASIRSPETLLVVDPAMADHGKLYAGFDDDFPKAMAQVVAQADVALPNLTEACLLTGTPYREDMDEPFARELLQKVASLGAKRVVLTGASFSPDKLGAMGYDSAAGTYFTCLGPRHPALFHGTGDIFAAAVTGGLVRGMALEQAVQLAVDFTLDCILATERDPAAGWYGVEFEKALPALVRRMEQWGE